jgi:hypothetical protein
MAVVPDHLVIEKFCFLSRKKCGYDMRFRQKNIRKSRMCLCGGCRWRCLMMPVLSGMYMFGWYDNR